jgi:tetratricopeptide (TPR) repeat protein
MAVTPEFTALCENARQLLRAGSFQKAIALFEQARQIDDFQIELFESLGTACFLLGDYEAAIGHFRRIIDLAPRHAAAFVNLGAVYNRLGDYPKAIETLRRGIQVDKNSAEGYYNLGIAHRRLKQNALAVPAYREAIRLAPDMVDAYQNLGNCYLDLGNHQQAVASFKKALELKPGFERATRGLERAEEATQAAKTSTNPFGRLVGSRPPDAEDAASAPAISQRVLSLAERLVDRHELEQLLAAVQESSKQLLQHVHLKLDPGIRELNRAVVEHSGDPVPLRAAHKKFRPCIETFEALTRELKSAVDELRAHEAQMNRGE